MRNFKRVPHDQIATGAEVVSTFPDQPHATLTVSPEGVTLGMIIYTGSQDGEWLGRSGKASYHTRPSPLGLRRAGRT